MIKLSHYTRNRKLCGKNEKILCQQSNKGFFKILKVLGGVEPQFFQQPSPAATTEKSHSGPEITRQLLIRNFADFQIECVIQESNPYGVQDKL